MSCPNSTVSSEIIRPERGLSLCVLGLSQLSFELQDQLSTLNDASLNFLMIFKGILLCERKRFVELNDSFLEHNLMMEPCKQNVNEDPLQWEILVLNINKCAGTITNISMPYEQYVSA